MQYWMSAILPWALHHTVPSVALLKARALRSDWLIIQGPKATVTDLSCDPEACRVLNLTKYIKQQANETGEKLFLDDYTYCL